MARTKQREMKNLRGKPDALNMNFPPILEDDLENRHSPYNALRPNRNFRMGRLRIAYCPATDEYPELLRVCHPHRLPTWDEMVYVRYAKEIGVTPNADMALLLPVLSEYINYDAGDRDEQGNIQENHPKYTLTMEAVDRTKTHA